VTVIPRRSVRRAALRRTSAAAGALVLVTSLASCTFGKSDPEPKPLDSASASTGSSSTPEPTATTDPALAKYYDQTLDWSTCRSTMRCAELTVPLDYAKPDGDTITLSVLEVPATGDNPIGAMLVNPGGPGGSGVDYAANATHYFGEPLRQSFDIVGFDPRGVGRSTPIDCLTDQQLDTFVASDPDPDTSAEMRQADQMMTQFGQGCLQRSGDLTRHVSTEEAARDMDILRGALGQEKMVYFGASYGTFLGATYADLFPERVGRMVLDGAIDPTMDLVDTSLVQAKGFEVALRAYVQNCVDNGGCYLGNDVDSAMLTIRNFLDQVDKKPLPGSGGRMLTEGEAVLGIWAPLYNRDYWSALDTALSQALNGNGATLLSFADAYVSRGPNGYLDNSSEALYAVNCLDNDESVSDAEVKKLEPKFEEASPTFGRVFDYGLTACRNWSVHSGKGPEKLTAPGAAPIMVIGTTRDPATPLEWAEALANQLESAVLVRRDGDGHTGYGAGNQCVDDTVESYLVSGTVPDGTVDC